MSEVCDNYICQQIQECPPTDSILNPLVAAENVCAGGLARYMETSPNPMDKASFAIEHAISTRDSNPETWSSITDTILCNIESSQPVDSLKGLLMAPALPLLQARANSRLPNEDEIDLAYRSTEDSLVIGGPLLKAINEVRQTTSAYDPQKHQRKNEYQESSKLVAAMVVSWLSLRQCLDDPQKSLVYPSLTRERERIASYKNFFGCYHSSYTVRPDNAGRQMFNYKLTDKSIDRRPGMVDLFTLSGEALTSTSDTIVSRGLTIGKIIKNLPLYDTDQTYRQKTFAKVLSESIQRAIVRVPERQSLRRPDFLVQ